MTNYVFTYSGGTGMGASPQEQEQVMAEWGAWFGSMAGSLVDGGNPFGPSCTIGSDGSTSEGGSSALGGYSIVTATDLAAASALAKGCPHLRAGGTVEVYETIAM